MSKGKKTLKIKMMSLTAKFVFCFGALVMSLLLFIGSFLFVYMCKQFYREQQQTIWNSVSCIDMMFAQYMNMAETLATELYHSSEGRQMLLSNSSVAANNYGFILEVNKSLQHNPFVHSVYIVNYENQVVMHTTNTNRFTEELEQKLPERLKKEVGRNIPFVWKVQDRYVSEDEIPLLCIYQREAPVDSSFYAGTVVVNGDLLWLAQALFPANSMTEYFILNSQGDVIVHSDASQCGEDYSYRLTVRNIVDGSSTLQREIIEDIPYEIYAIESQQEGFYIVAQVNCGNQIKGEKNVFILLAIAITAFCVTETIVFYMISKKMFSPLQRLVKDVRTNAGAEIQEVYRGDEVQYLEQSYANMSSYLEKLKKKEEENHIVRNLLIGNKVHYLLLNSERVFRDTSYYLILVYMPDNDEWKNLDECQVGYNGISEVIITSLERMGQCTCLEISFRRRLFLLAEESKNNSRGKDFKKNVEQVLRKVVEDLFENSIFVFTEYADTGECDFGKLYQKIDSKLKTRLLLKHKPELYIGTEVEDNQKELEELEKQLQQQFKAGRREGYLETLNLLLDVMADMKWEDFIRRMEGLIFELSSSREKVISQKAVEKERCKVRENLEVLKDRESLLEWFILLYDETSSEKQKINQYSNKDIMEKAIDYISNNYYDSNLNMSTLACKMNVSSSYFGKLFKGFSGCTVSEYLTKIRLEKAYDLLLLDPDRDIMQIAIEVGYSSAGYFTTAFKKRFGVSPSKLRDYVVGEQDLQQP